MTEYEETADEYVLGKLAELVDAQEMDKLNDSAGKINSEFTKVLDGIAAEAKNSRISSIWNSNHVVNFLLTLYALGDHFTKSKIMKVPWLKCMTDYHGGVRLSILIYHYS